MKKTITLLLVSLIVSHGLHAHKSLVLTAPSDAAGQSNILNITQRDPLLRQSFALHIVEKSLCRQETLIARVTLKDSENNSCIRFYEASSLFVRIFGQPLTTATIMTRLDAQHNFERPVADPCPDASPFAFDYDAVIDDIAIFAIQPISRLDQELKADFVDSIDLREIQDLLRQKLITPQDATHFIIKQIKQRSRL